MIVFATEAPESSTIEGCALTVPQPLVPIKICSGCGNELPVTEFRPRKGKNEGTARRRAECRACEWEQRRKNRQRKRRKALSRFAKAIDRTNSPKGREILIRAIIRRFGGIPAFAEAGWELVETARKTGRGLLQALRFHESVMNLVAAANPRPLIDARLAEWSTPELENLLAMVEEELGGREAAS